MANLPPKPNYAQPIHKPGNLGHAPRTNGLAIASLVLGLLSLLLSCLTGLIGIVLGIVALVQISKSNGRQTGGVMAMIGIITSVLFGLVGPVLFLLPAVMQVRQAAARTDSTNRMRQILLAELTYQDVFRSYPENKNGLSWRVHILPYLDEQALYDRFNLDEAWDSPTNKPLLAEMPDFFKSQGLNSEPGPGKTVFLRPVGNGAFPEDVKVRIESITDGTSNTFLVLEVDPEAAVNWTEPVDYQFDPNDPLRNLGNARPGVFVVGFCDGSTTTIPSNVSPETLKAGFTLREGDIFSAFDF